MSSSEMLIRRKLRHNLPALDKQNKITVGLSERNQQRTKQKHSYDRRVTKELELLKPGNSVRIGDPIKKKGGVRLTL